MNVIRNIIASIVLIALFGWAMSILYLTYVNFAEIIKNPELPMEMEIQLIPIILFIVIGGLITVFLFKINKKKHYSWRKILFLPTELEEADEREQQITAQACRSSYISMWIAAPIVTALLFIYPFISESMPYYPIIIILLLPTIQLISYGVTWKRESRI
ncbi:hypothetical protein [Bacillus sp. PS06]|uniref:hypothetical protein n=1 Tax=Bacillus sp. PS06 TaxID=2764176 RepID=UPI00177D1B1B|nr:hypothetical protein [Bacillus sp. PS06]MBD8067603.1 hypothetical protein [Bacillus sp. PS06]